jgi:hypothetical protein
VSVALDAFFRAAFADIERPDRHAARAVTT